MNEEEIKQSLSFNCKPQYISKYCNNILSKQYYIEEQRIFWGDQSELLSFDFLKNFKQNNEEDNFISSIFSFNSPNAKASIRTRTLGEIINSKTIKLRYSKKNSSNFFNLVKSRHSSRNFVNKSIDLLDLGTLLYYSCSINENNKVGSGGGLYPIEIYFYASNIKDLRKGFYKYNKFSHSINPINYDEPNLKEIIYVDKNQEKANLILFYVNNQNINIFKYGDLSVMLSFWEAGAISQNISLICESTLLGCCDYGGMVPQKISKFLKLDKYFNQNVVGCTLIGRLE